VVPTVDNSSPTIPEHDFGRIRVGTVDSLVFLECRNYLAIMLTGTNILMGNEQNVHLACQCPHKGATTVTSKLGSRSQ